VTPIEATFYFPCFHGLSHVILRATIKYFSWGWWWWVNHVSALCVTTQSLAKLPVSFQFGSIN